MKTFILISCLLLSINTVGQVCDSAAVDSIFIKWNKPNVPGCALGIIKDGKLIYAKGYGMANLDYDIPNTANTVFRIASTSKQFTAACIVLLAEQGKLRLDDNLSKFFPGFPGYANHITIWNLLHHTSGIRDYITLMALKGLEDDDTYTDKDVMKLLIHQQHLNFQPGDKFLYSNSGYWLLGQIVNKVAGVNMADFSKQKIFEPLGMTSTHFHNDHDQIVKNRATGYAPDDSGDYRIDMTLLNMIGDGGVFTNIEDIKKWDDAFYNSDIFNKTFWDTMLERGVLNNGDTLDYACGLERREYRGLQTISHGGAFVGFRSDIIRFPKQKFTVVILANRADANPTKLCYEVANLFLQNQFKVANPVPKEINRDKVSIEAKFNLGQISGTYLLQPGVALEISLQDGSLSVIQKWDSSTYKIVRTKGNTFQIPGKSNISFTFSDLKGGKVHLLTILQNGKKTNFTRKKNMSQNPVKLEDYTGKYYSKELDVAYEFTVKKDKLQVSVGNHDSIEVVPFDVDQFFGEGILFKFERKGNQITGFNLDVGRVTNLLFVKVK